MAAPQVKAHEVRGVTLDAVAPLPFTPMPSAGAHGSITLPFPQSVLAGSSVTLAAAAAGDYHLADVLVDG